MSKISQLSTPHLHPISDNLVAVTFELMKVLPAYHVVKQVLARAPHVETIIETTSGTAGLALAYVCNELGLELILVSDPAIDPLLQNRIETLGGQLLLVSPEFKTKPGGFQKARLALVKSLLKAKPKAAWTQQYKNPNWRLAYASAAAEMVAQGLETDILVATCGSGASGCGVRDALANFRPVRFCAVDTPGSVLFGAPEARRDLRGLGNSLIPGNLNHRLVDTVVWSTNAAAVAAAHHLCSIGLDVGPTSGAAWLAARWQAKRYPARQVAFICPDNARRYPEVNDKALLASRGWLQTGLPVRPARVAHPSKVELDVPLQFYPWERSSLDSVNSIKP